MFNTFATDVMFFVLLNITTMMTLSMGSVTSSWFSLLSEISCSGQLLQSMSAASHHSCASKCACNVMCRLATFNAGSMTCELIEDIFECNANSSSSVLFATTGKTLDNIIPARTFEFILNVIYKNRIVA